MNNKKLIALVVGLALCGSIFAAPKYGLTPDVAHHHHHHHGHHGWGAPPPPPPSPPPPPPPPTFHRRPYW